MRGPRQLVMIVAALALPFPALAQFPHADSIKTSWEWVDVSGSASGFQSDTDATHKVKVAGIVVNSVTGVGVMKALVEVQPGVSPVFTGPDGRFEVDGLPEGEYSFTVRKPGYFSEQELHNGGVGRPAVTVTEQNTPEVRLKLTPEASVEGHVVDGSGEPIESATIQLMMQTIENGRKTWRQADWGQTDEDGEYSVMGVRPGDYVLRVSASGGAESRLEGQNYDDIHLTQYYSGAPSRDQATVLHISGGQVAQADVTLKKAKGYRISGQIPGLPAGEGVTLFLADAQDSDADAWSGTDGQGRFTVHGVAPGTHTIRGIGQGPGGQSMLFGETSVNVEQNDVKNIAIGLQPAFQIPVQVEVTETHSADGSTGMARPATGGNAPNVPPLGYLTLAPFDRDQAFSNRGGGTSVTLQANSNPAEPMVLKNVLPGKYRVEIALIGVGNNAFYVESARAGDTDLLTSPLTVSQMSGSLPIVINIRDDAATLDITVKKDQSLRMAALLITSAAGTEPRFLFSGGKFRSPGLAPGDYRVYAFDDSEGLEYANPEALREFVGKSKAVSLAANQTAEVTVEVIHRGGP